jgi:hypothetical protein
MTPAEWAAKNGIIDRVWIARQDAYEFVLNTGHRIPFSGQEFYFLDRAAGTLSQREMAVAVAVRDKWLALRKQHFIDAYARGGYC